MENLVRDYGGEFYRGDLDAVDTFGSSTIDYDILDSNVIRITEEMRNKLLLEGIPDFAIGGIVNKGIATLKTAKQPTEGIVDLGLY